MNEDGNRGGARLGGGESTVAVPLEAGTEVCVWNRFLDGWTDGFAVAGVEDGGYRLTRLSDGHVFEDVFPTDVVIPERRKIQTPGFLGTEHDRRREGQTSAPAGNGSRGEPFLR